MLENKKNFSKFSKGKFSTKACKVFYFSVVIDISAISIYIYILFYKLRKTVKLRKEMRRKK